MSDAARPRNRLARQKDAWWEERLHAVDHPIAKAVAVPKVLLGLAFLMAVISSVISVGHGWSILYNDAETHLNIARRTFSDFVGAPDADAGMGTLQ